ITYNYQHSTKTKLILIIILKVYFFELSFYTKKVNKLKCKIFLSIISLYFLCKGVLTMKKSHKNFLIIAIILILSVVALNFVLTSSKKGSVLSNGKDVADNIEKIKSLEKSNIKDIEDDISKVQKELNPKDSNSDMNNKPKNNASSEESAPSINYKEVFSSSVIMGDSQSEGLIVYGVLNPTSVIAKKGGGIVDSKTNNMTKLSNLSPANVFTLYGMNDILNYQNNIDGFIADYTALIKEIQKTLPDSKIFVNSILPVEEKVIVDRPVYKEISNYNEALKQMCSDLGITYVNTHQILIDNPTLFEADGMHLKPPFYNKWLDLLSTYL
ncbi:MAG: GDSL-type esterase/lipase family protein, partial [Sarcina sp.]